VVVIVQVRKGVEERTGWEAARKGLMYFRRGQDLSLRFRAETVTQLTQTQT